MAATRAGKPRTPDAIRKRIQELTWADNPGTYIFRAMKSEFPLDYPELRTVQKLAREYRQAKPDGKWWSVADVDAEEARQVLPVLGELARRRIADRISKELAAWIAKLRTVAPEMPPFDLYLMANRYLWAATWRAETTYLDVYMALELWRSEDAEMDAVAFGLIPAAWHNVTRNSPDLEEGADR